MMSELQNLTNQINDAYISDARNNVAIGSMIHEAAFLLVELNGDRAMDAYDKWIDSLLLSPNYVEVVSNDYCKYSLERSVTEH